MLLRGGVLRGVRRGGLPAQNVADWGPLPLLVMKLGGGVSDLVQVQVLDS